MPGTPRNIARGHPENLSGRRLIVRSIEGSVCSGSGIKIADQAFEIGYDAGLIAESIAAVRDAKECTPTAKKEIRYRFFH